jgi:ribose transport system ATP-binding protein
VTALGVLRFDNIEKSFGGTQALKGVSFEVRRGEIVALLGENGAGKSTLIKILSGVHKADSGAISLDGVHYPGARGGSDRNVAFVHQDLGLIEWMTVSENVALARGFARSSFLGRAGIIDWTECDRTARDALSRIRCDIEPDTRIQSLSRTEKSLVAIARALVVECDFLVLDEPTASLPADEVARLFTAMGALKARGVGMIYVSHRLDEVFRIADRVVVLRDGRVVGEERTQDTNPARLIGMIVGRTTFDAFKKDQRQPGAVRVSVSALTTARAGPADFEVRRGELLGLVGLRGAGQEDIGRALFGATPHQGVVSLDGEALDLSSAHAALRQGVGLMARDRGEESIAASLTVRENLFLNPAASGRTAFSPLPPRVEAEKAIGLGASLDLRPNDPALAIEGLSGGNQQKVVVGRWLATNRRLLVAEDPTAGVDVGAKAEIYGLMARALDEGLAVIVVSTDFEEIAQICHRAIIFNRGRIVGELAGDALTTEAVIMAASASEAS